MKKATTLWSCDFCGKNEHQIKLLIAGPNCIAICNECIAVCGVVVAQAEAKRPSASSNQSK